MKGNFFLSSAENGLQNLHYFSFAAYSGNECDEHQCLIYIFIEY